MEKYFIVWRESKHDKLGNTTFVTKEKSFETEAKRLSFFDKLSQTEKFVEVQDWRTEVS